MVPLTYFSSYRFIGLPTITLLFCVGCSPEHAAQTVKVEVLGVYPVDAPEPCHLIEVQIRGAQNSIDLGQFTQDIPGKLPSNRQVPWMEQILSPEGDRVIADSSAVWRNPDLLRGDIRIVFFFHYLNRDWPLSTPFGEFRIPADSKLPERLSTLKYETPG
jgi:hypothetical protein